ncbi:MAG: lysostaphin resistance A-like protein [Deltaproteobacteria bacterium]
MESLFVDDTGRLRTAWRFAIFGAGFLAIQIALGIVSVIGIAVYLAATGTPADSLTSGLRRVDDWQVPLQIVATLPMTMCDLGLVLICRRFLDQRSIRSVGFVRPGRSFTESVAGGLLLGLLPVALVIGVLLAMGGLVWEAVSASTQTALLVPTFVVAAFNEEIICRGYLLQNLIDLRRPWFGVVFSSTVFWLLHALNPAAWSSPIISLNLFGAGVALALAYRASGNIWFPTAVHFGWNFAQGVLFQVPVSGVRTDGLIDVRIVESAPTWLTGGAFGIEGSILATVAEIGMSIVLGCVLFRRSRQSVAGAAQAGIFLIDADEAEPAAPDPTGGGETAE